jgi:hypothetical protein
LLALTPAGFTWQRSSCIDSHGCPLLSDAYGAPLTFSGQSSDSSIMGLASMVYRWAGRSDYCSFGHLYMLLWFGPVRDVQLIKPMAW